MHTESPYIPPLKLVGFTGLFLNRYIIDQKLLSIRGAYLIKDSQGNEIGKAEGKLFSWGAKYQLLDAP